MVVVTSKKGKRSIASRVIFEAARDNLTKDAARRWWCNRYNLPPTDPRLGAYTDVELLIEWAEWALDNKLVTVDSDGVPPEKVVVNGIEINDPKDEKWASKERSWAESPTFDELNEMIESMSDPNEPETFIAGGKKG